MSDTDKYVIVSYGEVVLVCDTFSDALLAACAKYLELAWDDRDDKQFSIVIASMNNVGLFDTENALRTMCLQKTSPSFDEIVALLKVVPSDVLRSAFIAAGLTTDDCLNGVDVRHDSETYGYVICRAPVFRS